MSRRVVVFGPAYLDRVLLVDRPLADPSEGGPLDQSVVGHWKFGVGLAIVDPRGSRIVIQLPKNWPGPQGEVLLSQEFPGSRPACHVEATATVWHDDLGGMGAGFASAFGGVLVSALGPEDDPTSQEVAQRLADAGIAHHPIRVTDRAADWTLLVNSGPHGDKLPIGFRGCHAAIESLEPWLHFPCDLRVVASLPNPLAQQALCAEGSAVRLFAPAMRNMSDRTCPVSRFAESIDVLCCNRHEWEALDDREEVAWTVSLLAITDGPAGSRIRFTTPSGDAGVVEVPAFSRRRPPRDTNRAGEAYAATLITTLLDSGWRPGVTEESLVVTAARRAAAAAALVLDRVNFGFPSAAEIDRAMRIGQVD